MILFVVAVGKVRSAALRSACDDYLSRARRYFRLEIREAPAPRGGRSAPEARRAEAAGLVRRVPPGVLLVALTRDGTREDSPGFARRVAAWQRRGRDVAVLIGGASGLDPSLLAQSDSRLSLSPFTLPHEMARMLFLEQLYRAGTILRGEPYHKGGG